MWTAVLATLNLARRHRPRRLVGEHRGVVPRGRRRGAATRRRCRPRRLSRRLSIVVASNGAAGSVERCLATLERQVDGAEVIVCEPSKPGGDATAAFPFAHVTCRSGRSCPSSGATGSRLEGEPWRSRSRRCCLLRTGSTSLGRRSPTPTRSAARSSPPRGCASSTGRVLLPLQPGHAAPSERSSARPARRQRRLQAGWAPGGRDTCRDGFWEPDVHRAMRGAGEELWHSPELVALEAARQGSGLLRQRYHHGRHRPQARARFAAPGNLAGRRSARRWFLRC